MGLREKLLRRSEPKQVALPAILEPEDPVNYDSVLDWIVGLSKDDYEKFVGVAQIYREANHYAATT